jgi:uncharacterized membrane protein YeaQ/YmgE (transglycosylase-associated protein family)
MNNSYRLLLSALFGLIGTFFAAFLGWYILIRTEQPSMLTVILCTIGAILWWYRADDMKRSYDEHNHKE